MSEKNGNLLICPYCKEEFKGYPKELPCKHSVCESPCLEKITSSSPSRCPKCNEEHVLSSDPGSLPTENTLQQLLSLKHVYDTLPLRKYSKNVADSDDYDNVKGKSVSKDNETLRTIDKDKVRKAIKDSIKLIKDSIKRICEIQVNTSMIINYNPSVSKNADLKRHFQCFRQQEIEIDNCLRLIESNIDTEMKTHLLLTNMWQCEEHLSAILETEFSQLIFDVKRELNKHSPTNQNSATTVNLYSPVGEQFTVNNATPPQSADEVAGSRDYPCDHQHGQVDEVTYDELTETASPDKDVYCFQSISCSNDGLGMCSKVFVCSITTVMTCVKIGIGIWNIAQHDSILAIIAACSLIVKTIIETCLIYWLVFCWFKSYKSTRKYIILIVILVIIGVALLSDIVLVYVNDEGVNLPLRVMRIITIVDIVWTFLILITIWLLESKCLRN